MVGRMMGDVAPGAEAELSAGAPMTWVDQVVVLGQGFLGSMTALDLETGVVTRRLFRLDADGMPKAASTGEISLDGAGSSAEVAYRSLPAAATGSAALLARLEALRAATKDLDLAWVVPVGAQVWLLTGDLRASGPQAEQALFRVDLDPAAPLRLEPLPLDDLRIGPDRPVTLMARLGDGMVLAVADPVAGFDLVRPRPDGSGFDTVLGQGALRFAVNAAVTAVAAGPEGLLIGTAALATGEQPLGAWGPELIELRPDGSWRLIVGMPRFTPTGAVHPISGQKPGFGQPGHAAITAIGAGMLRGRPMTCVVVQDHLGPAVEDRRLIEADLLAYGGAVQIYGSTDLNRWVRITWDDSAPGCVTSLAVGNHGLLIGHEGADSHETPVSILQP